MSDSTRFLSAEKLQTMRVKTVDVLFKNNLVFLRSAARAQLGIEVFFKYFSSRGNVFATGCIGGLIKPSNIEYGLCFLSWTGSDSNERFAKAEIQ